MDNNKIILGDEVLIDLTSDTVTADVLLEGTTAHDASGRTITGTAVGGATTASELAFDDTTSHLGSSDVQGAIDNLAESNVVLTEKVTESADWLKSKNLYDETYTLRTTDTGSANNTRSIGSAIEVSGVIEVKKNTLPSTTAFKVSYYSSSSLSSAIDDSGEWITDSNTHYYTLPSNARYVRIYFKRTDEGTMNTSDFSGIDIHLGKGAKSNVQLTNEISTLNDGKRLFAKETATITFPLKLKNGHGVWLIIKDSNVCTIAYYSGSAHLEKIFGSSSFSATSTSDSITVTDTNGWWGRWLVIPWYN